MPSTLRTVAFSAAIATLCALAATLAVLAVSRPSILLAAPSASSATTGTSTFDPGVITSGDGLVSKKPDPALISVGVESKESTATAAQQDLAAKAGKLIARAKALGLADKDINTAGYFVGPNYLPGGSIDGYRASEQLRLKWHDVDTVGKALDALVQEGGGGSTEPRDRRRSLSGSGDGRGGGGEARQGATRERPELFRVPVEELRPRRCGCAGLNPGPRGTAGCAGVGGGRLRDRRLAARTVRMRGDTNSHDGGRRRVVHDEARAHGYVRHGELHALAGHRMRHGDARDGRQRVRRRCGCGLRASGCRASFEWARRRSPHHPVGRIPQP